MKNDFRIAINQICNERQLPKEVVIQAIEAALVSAYKKNFGSNQNITVRIDPDTGRAHVYNVRQIVEDVKDPRLQISLTEARRIDAMVQIGGNIEQEMTPRDFGRIAAQTAKQVILQRIREAERDAVYSEYAEREGEIVNGTVRNIDEHGNVILALGKAEAVLQPNEQIPGEHYRNGQRLRTYVVEVQKTSRGPQITVSRTHRQFLKRLLELEVPEIFNGTVEIKAISREPGSRSKVAVAASQEGVDPVGSCVGVRGVRIQNVVNELNGEKIDVVAWNPAAAIFVANALSPAKPAEVEIDEATKTATVVVPDKQLSLAIGKEGQNARLAAKLTGWRIDIRSTSEAAAEAQRRAEAAAAAAAAAAQREAAVAAARELLRQAEESLRTEEGVALQVEAKEEMPVTLPAEPKAKEIKEEPRVVEVVSEAPVEVVSAEGTKELPGAKEVVVAVPTRAEEGKPVTVERPAAEVTAETEEEWREEEGELPDEDYDDQKRKAKKQKRHRQRELVFDDQLGEVVSRHRRKPSRRQDSWESDDWNKGR